MRGNYLCEITTCSVWYIGTYGTMCTNMVHWYMWYNVYQCCTLIHMVQYVPIWYNYEGFEFLYSYYPLVQWLATFFTHGSIG